MLSPRDLQERGKRIVWRIYVGMLLEEREIGDPNNDLMDGKRYREMQILFRDRKIAPNFLPTWSFSPFFTLTRTNVILRLSLFKWQENVKNNTWCQIAHNNPIIVKRASFFVFSSCNGTSPMASSVVLFRILVQMVFFSSYRDLRLEFCWKIYYTS